MSTRVKVYVFLALFVALAAAGGYFIKQRRPGGFAAQAKSGGPGPAMGKAAKKAMKDSVVPVELAQASRGPISSYLTSTANLRALRDVEVASQADGVVREVLVQEGDFVQQGQLLCRLDDRENQIKLKLTEEKLAQVRQQLEKAKIQNEKAGVQIGNTRTELKRNETAFAEGLVSEKEVDDLRYQLAELEHDQRVAASDERENSHRVEELEAEIDQAKLEISRTRITAPFAGRITERKVEIGQTVRNLDSVFKLGAFSPLYADAHLSEREAQQVRIGQRARVRLGSESSEAEAAQVARISPVVDGATGTVKVTLELTPSDPAFKPGAFVRVQIETDARQEATLVPKRAILEEDGETYVFVAEDQTARRRKVTVGYEAEREVEIRDGVSAGEKIVVAGQGNLKEGDKIREIET